MKEILGKCDANGILMVLWCNTGTGTDAFDRYRYISKIYLDEREKVNFLLSIISPIVNVKTM